MLLLSFSFSLFIVSISFPAAIRIASLICRRKGCCWGGKSPFGNRCQQFFLGNGTK